MCDRVAVMYLGKIVELAETAASSTRIRATPTPARCSRPCRCPIPVWRPAGVRQILTGDIPSPTNPPAACRFHTRCPKFVEGRCGTDEPRSSARTAETSRPATPAQRRRGRRAGAAPPRLDGARAAAPSACATRCWPEGVRRRVRELPDSTRTAPEAAAAVGCIVERIVKSLVFRGARSGTPLLVLASGGNLVDEARVADLVGEPVEKADADFVRAQTGYAIGGIPRLGHDEPLRDADRRGPARARRGVGGGGHAARGVSAGRRPAARAGGRPRGGDRPASELGRPPRRPRASASLRRSAIVSSSTTPPRGSRARRDGTPSAPGRRSRSSLAARMVAAARRVGVEERHLAEGVARPQRPADLPRIRTSASPSRITKKAMPPAPSVTTSVPGATVRSFIASATRARLGAPAWRGGGPRWRVSRRRA